MPKFACLTLLLILSLSSSLPVPSNRPDSRRHVRQSSSSLEYGNISAPSYVVDLFKNVTENPPRNALPTNDDLINAVRSFPNIARGSECGTMSFNISAISSTEYVVKSMLRVHVRKSNSSGALVAHLKHHHNGTEITNIPVNGDWVEFKIAPIIAEWVKQRNSGPHKFKVEITQSGNRVSCSSVAITTSITNLNLQPLLVVHSIDPNIEDMPLLKGIRHLMETVEIKNRTKRHTVTTATAAPTRAPLSTPCKKHDVHVHRDWLNELVVNSGVIIGPTKYNAGICGGACQREVPRSPEHAVIFHLLVTGRNSAPPKLPSPTMYDKCCVPVKYGHMHFVLHKDDVFEMWKLPNSVVKECGCVHYKKY